MFHSARLTLKSLVEQRLTESASNSVIAQGALLAQTRDLGDKKSVIADPTKLVDRGFSRTQPATHHPAIPESRRNQT